MNVSIINPSKQLIHVISTAKLERRLVGVLLTDAQKLVGLMIPSYPFLNCNLIQHQHHVNDMLWEIMK